MTDLLSVEPDQLLQILISEYSITIPAKIETTDDLEYAAEVMSKAAGLYSFFSGLRMQARVQKRLLKRRKEDAALVEDMLMKEEIFEYKEKEMMQMYNTVSRMITVKQQINAEMQFR